MDEIPQLIQFWHLRMYTAKQQNYLLILATKFVCLWKMYMQIFFFSGWDNF